MSGMVESTGRFRASIEDCNGWLGKLANTIAVWDMATNYVGKLDSAMQGLSASGIDLDAQMHDLSAVAGVVGEDLKTIETYARSSAKAFGTDAGVAVEGYKLLLGQLSPEIAKCPEALASMGESIQITSKLMGNDGVGAAEVLTTAMNQYGVSLEDPIAASAKMAEMMNVMAAAGQEGSAELPAIKAALEQCGMAAKAANVSFEETAAAIEVLDAAGKKGSEGGVAIRNTLAIMGEGRFLPRQTKKELEAAGIDIEKLADTSLSLHDRLEMLKPVMNDAALFSKLFGMENSNAARALVQGNDELARLMEAVTGTKSAEEQAAVVMDSYAERQRRVNQSFEDFKISVFQATGDLSLWVTTIMGALVPISQLFPLIMGIGKAMLWVKSLQWAAMWSCIVRHVRSAAIVMALMTDSTALANGISLGFIGNLGRMTFQLLRFATVGVMQALKGLGAFILSLVTGGATSATFAGIASASFTAFKASAVSACRAVSIAIMNIPIIGWIAAAIAALIAIGVYFWNTSVKFRAVLKGLWAAFKATFTGIGDLAKATFSAIGDLIKAAFSLDVGGIDAALTKLKKGFSDYGSAIGKAFNEAYDAEMTASAKEEAKKNKKEGKKGTASVSVPTVETPTVNTPNPTGDTLSGAKGGSGDGGGGGTIRSITINVEKLVERFEIHTTNLAEDAGRVKELVSGALLSALNDVNLAI